MLGLRPVAISTWSQPCRRNAGSHASKAAGPLIRLPVAHSQTAISMNTIVGLPHCGPMQHIWTCGRTCFVHRSMHIQAPCPPSLMSALKNNVKCNAPLQWCERQGHHMPKHPAPEAVQHAHDIFCNVQQV